MGEIVIRLFNRQSVAVQRAHVLISALHHDQSRFVVRVDKVEHENVKSARHHCIRHSKAEKIQSFAPGHYDRAQVGDRIGGNSLAKVL